MNRLIHKDASCIDSILQASFHCDWKTIGLVFEKVAPLVNPT